MVEFHKPDKKTKRSERIAAILLMLGEKPNEIHTLSYFSTMFHCAKSTLSEDIALLRNVLEKYERGTIETIPGAAGGIRYFPRVSKRDSLNFIQEICNKLNQPSRIMVGGFIYMADVFSDPAWVRKLGIILAQQFYKKEPDVVVTIESKGVPIGLMTAQALGCPIAVARKENRATEGSVVMINYKTSSNNQFQSMNLPRRALTKGKRALIIDDFVKGGGTVSALCDMMKEFDCEVVGIGALVSALGARTRQGSEIQALMALSERDEDQAELRPARWLEA